MGGGSSMSPQGQIRHVFQDSDVSTWSYESFPKLPRCLAVLYETLRLYNPLLSIVKGTAVHPADLIVDAATYTVLPHTRVILNLNAVHTHPRYWGHDSLDFKASRWVVTDGPSIDREYLRAPLRGAFMGWSDGSRVCPGRKFVQVEHVAVVVALCRDHHVEPVRLEGESAERARKRVVECVGESGMRLLFQMLRPESVALAWRER
ncbi:uncharacterized protein K452DRAFT_130448 [Neofusicoccum parvum]|nr:uncharacterized protein K452DRAFT_130448 [Neofusicoccum parvum]